MKLELGLLIVNIIVLVILAVELYYAHLIGANIRILFDEVYRNIKWDINDDKIEFTGVFVNDGNASGYLLENPSDYKQEIYSKFAKNRDSKYFGTREFDYLIEPDVPIEKIWNDEITPLPNLFKPGDTLLPVKFFVEKKRSSDVNKNIAIQEWFKEHMNQVIEIKIHYTVTGKSKFYQFITGKGGIEQIVETIKITLTES